MNNKLKYFIYSQNSINTYKSCPTKFKYKYIDKINWKYDDIESREYYDSLKVGSEFHLLCERYFSNIPLGLNEYTNPKFKVWIDKIKNMFPMNKKNNKIYLPEYEVRFNLDGSIITAKYDLIIIDENSIEVWDWKTENVKLEYIKVKDRIQTVVYMFLAKEAVCKIFNLNIDYNNIKMKYYQPQYDDIPIEILPLVSNLNQFFARTEQQLKRERRFVSDAAHELRSPLAALRIQTEVAQLAGDDTKTREMALIHLTQGIDRANQLIEQLLTLSRLDNLNELDEQALIDWSEIITSLVSELFFNALNHQIDLSFDYQHLPPIKLGQPLLLSQMLRNLLDNAIKYCPKGTEVRVILQRTKILIEDNGGGVEPEELAKLGQRFYRPAGQNEKGSGLGLSIVARIAELHHYRFYLENIEYQGKIQGLRAVIEL